MKFNSTRLAAVALTAVAGLIIALAYPLHAGESADPTSSCRRGQLHITKLCTNYTGAAGSYCTVATSNLSELPSGTTVYYDQAFGIPAGNLDSNVMLYVSSGNWAVGRCTVEAATGKGLCRVVDGVGPLAGFSARVTVVIDPKTLITYWDGTYSFDPPETK